MGLPEKERKDDSNLNDSQGTPPPKFESFGSDQERANPSDVFDEIDSYQKKIEHEWETAKDTYQKKIGQIMDDFVQQTGVSQDKSRDTSPPRFKEEKIPPPPKSKSLEPLSRSEFDEKLDHLMENVQKTLQKAERQSPYLTYSGYKKPPIINIPWRPLRPWNRILLKLVLVSALLGAAGFSGWFMIWRIDAVTPLPYSHATGLTIRENKVTVVDWFRKTLYVHKLKKGLPIAAVENFPNPFVTGVTSTHKNFFSINGFSQQILFHTLTPDHRVMERMPAPGEKTTGLFWDKTHLWTFDNAEGELYQLLANDLEEIKNTYSLENVFVTALQIFNHRTWILTGKTREIRVYRLQDPLRELASFDLDPFLKGSIPTGLHVEENTVWVSAEDPAQIIRIPRKKLEKADPNQF